MRFTIGKKLTASFSMLALLVLLSGIIGIVILNKVTHSTDMVVKEKVPIQYSVMRANMTVKAIEKTMSEYISDSSDLARKEQKLLAQLDEFDMWISMLEHGTSSDKFIKSRSYKIYQALKLNVIVPQSSKKMLKTLNTLKKESAVLKKGCADLVLVHNEYVAYSVTANGKNYDLPLYLMMLEKQHLKIYSALENAIISVVHFDTNTDPAKGMLGTWIRTYKTENKKLNKSIKKLDKYNKKQLGTIVKVNEVNNYDGKARLLSKITGPAARITQILGKTYDFIIPVYQKFDATKTERLNSLAQSAVKINKEFENLIKNAEEEMAFAQKNSELFRKNGTTILIVLTIIAVLIAAILGIYISRYLTKNITALASVTKLIAKGDLKNRVDLSSKDELGDLASDTNAMTDNLRSMISQITEFSEQLINSSSDLSDLSFSMSKGTANVTKRAESVAVAAEEMSTNMDLVATTSEQAATNINTVSIATDEINSSINEISKNSEIGNSISQEAVKKAESATQKVNELGRAAREISKVTEAISEISDQTNLLALNATIEAARAGEAGKGFAVVASEIKQLAIQTKEATEDIKKRIESIQNSTSDTALEIKGVTQIIGDINEIVGTIAAAVEEQSATTKEISQNMGQASAGLLEVTENVSQSNLVSSEIAKDISEVSANSNKVLPDCELVSSNSGELKKLARDLQKLVGQFKL